MFLSQRFFYIAAVIAVLSALGFWWSPFYIAAIVALCTLSAATLLDGVLTRIALQFKGKRHVDKRICICAQNKVTLTIINDSRLTTRVTLIDESPAGINHSPIGSPQFILRPGQKISTNYYLMPTQRGHYRFGHLLAFASTTIGLWQHRISLVRSQDVKVYPEFRQLKEREQQYLMYRDVKGSRKMVRSVSHSTEFEEIREYVKGDDYRRINWKATARRQILMVNHYDEERSQLLYNIIDHGRQMQRSFEGLTLADYAVNATLQLSFTAMNHDDLVGLVTFGHGSPRVVPARKSHKQLNILLEQLYRLQWKYAESDFSQLVSTLVKCVPRRALIMLYTDFYTLDALYRQLPHLQRIARRHALVVVFFEDRQLKTAATPLPPQASNGEHIIHALSADLVLQKQTMVDILRRNGINAILTIPDLLTGNVVRRYFTLKQQGAW